MCRLIIDSLVISFILVVFPQILMSAVLDYPCKASAYQKQAYFDCYSPTLAEKGVCVNATLTSCCNHGFFEQNLCPLADSKDMQCCLRPICTVPLPNNQKETGLCILNTHCDDQGGKTHANYCRGGDNVICCTSSWYDFFNSDNIKFVTFFLLSCFVILIFVLIAY